MTSHIDSTDCWCHPVEMFENEVTGAKVMVHQEPDGTLPPASVLADAIADTFKDDSPDKLYDVNGEKIE